LVIETPESRLKLDPDLEHSLRDLYGSRTGNVLSAMLAIPTRYFFRVNTLKANRHNVIESMRSKGLLAEAYDLVNDAGVLRPQPSKIESHDVVVEVDRIAAEAVQLGAHLYAPGVRRCHGLRPGMKVTVVDENGTAVGSGVSHQSETSILTYRQGIAVEVEQSRSGLPSILETPWNIEGLIHLQSLPAILTSHILDPKPCETVVDLNCAPGGKTSHICQLSKNEAEVIGFDRNKKKIQKTRDLMQRMGCSNYQLVPHDSRYVHLDYAIKADKVLVDPPCTALGIMPKLSIETTMQDVQNSADYQKQFLTAASHIVKKGGTIVYSVCTITKEECEDVVSFAEGKLELELEDQSPFLAGTGFDPYPQTQRFNPDTHETGYFIARFSRK
jgi:16S rRNA (cytosine967-C5)-methyltransferase